MHRTTNTTESIISLGEKLQSHGWARLSRKEKRRVVANIDAVAPFLRPDQHVILCEVFTLVYKQALRRPVGKVALEAKVRRDQITRRQSNAAKLNLDWS